MRTKHFLLILCFVVVTTILFIVLGPAGEPNDSLQSIVKQTHQQINKLQDTLRVAEKKKLNEIDDKYLAILGFTTNSLPTKIASYNKYNVDRNTIPSQQQQQQQDVAISIQHLPLQSDNAAQQQPSALLSQQSPSEMQNAQQQNNNNNNLQFSNNNAIKPSHTPRVTTTPYNTTKFNFSIVTYVQDGQAPSAILLAQNVAAKFPNEYLLIYDLGLSEVEARSLQNFCNSSKCIVISYDLSLFPSYVADQRMHAYRPIVIKDALMRSKSILFIENYMRIHGSSRDLNELQNRVQVSGVLGWSTATAVSTRTHPKMFEYFQKDADDFYFLRMVDLDVALFTDSLFVTDQIMLPWLKCALTLECIDPIGAQSHGCKYNKKPSYRYSGCHAYDASAFNIVLGLTWHMDYEKYSLQSDSYNIFYKETLEQATKILENRRRNSSETSEHAFTEE